MGIRFYCPNGHKLHVKEFQAGRQGICPHCGISMEIPLASTRPSSKKRRGGDPDEGAQDIQTVHVGRSEARTVQSAAAAAQTHPVGAGRSDSGATVAGASSAPSTTSPPQPASSIPRPGVPAPSSQRPVDPLDEVPTAVWYVRPPSGGQFGPATRDVMRSWLAEGRVSADSLVWREGWRDWSSAADIFPQFAADTATPAHLDFLDDEIPRSTTSVRKAAGAAPSTPNAVGGSPRRLGLWIAGIVVALLVIGAIVAVVVYKNQS
jgi:hypothetical protein